VVDTHRQYERLSDLYLPIAICVFAAVVVLLIAFALRYRARPDDARPPSRTHRAPRVEALYALVLAGVAAFLLTATFRTEAKTDRALSDRGTSGVRIDVVAAKWRWRFVYPGTGIVEQAPVPELVVPAGEPVRFTLISRDVIHSFWIPSLAFKRAAYPRFTQRFTLTFPRPGFTRAGGECAEYCGLYHDQMRFDVRVLGPAAFAAWERSRGAVT